MTDLPLEIKVQVALEDTSRAKAGQVYYISEFDGRAGKPFGSGAEHVRIGSVIYDKIGDIAEFDDGMPLRKMVYRRR